MTLTKIITLVLFYFFTRIALSAPCETFTSSSEKHRICWNDQHKGWFSENCSADKSCEALTFVGKKHKVKLVAAVGGQNPSTLACHSLKLPVAILRDSRNNEQSFCIFPDKSMTDANSIEKAIE